MYVSCMLVHQSSVQYQYVNYTTTNRSEINNEIQAALLIEFLGIIFVAITLDYTH